MSASKQLALFPAATVPRAPRVHRMHMVDAGPGVGGSAHVARYKCARCGSESEWMTAETVTEIRRGIPCDRCNSKGTEAPPPRAA